MVTNKEINKYISDVRTLIPIRDKSVNQFLEDLRTGISEYTESNADATMDDIIGSFGSPTDAAFNYIESLDTDKLIHRLKISKIVRLLATIMIFLVLFLTSFRAALLYKGYLDAENAIITKEQTVIVYEGDSE